MADAAGEIGYFAGFVWAVPEAFAPAVCSYRFEQGDVLYRARAGYAPLSDRIDPGLTAIQLRLPTRSARAVPGEFDGDRRLANWQSEVELELVDLARGQSEIRTSTQGRLLMTLWRGDPSWLEPAQAEPRMPRSARDLAQLLRDGAVSFPHAAGAGEGCRFVFVVDLSSDASRSKAVAVEEALHSLGPIRCRDRRPDESVDPGREPFHPTLVLREVALSGVSPEDAEGVLKRALYAGSSGEGERFQIARHGLLEAVQQIAAD